MPRQKVADGDVRQNIRLDKTALRHVDELRAEFATLGFAPSLSALARRGLEVLLAQVRFRKQHGWARDEVDYLKAVGDR
jgi:hypothetical protein